MPLAGLLAGTGLSIAVAWLAFSTSTAPKDVQREPIEQPALTEATSPLGPTGRLGIRPPDPHLLGQGPAEDRTSSSPSNPDPKDVEAPKPQEKTIKVRPGDNFARILERAGHSAATVEAILDAGEAAEALAQLRPGQELTLLQDADGHLIGIHYTKGPANELRIERGEEGFEAELVRRELNSTLRHIEGQVAGSFYRSARDAGLTDRLTMQLARVLDGDIDLGRDLREGDTFSVLYEKIESQDGKLFRRRLKGVRLEGARAEIEGIQYELPSGQSGFYRPDGTSLERTFDRYPLEFQRISSHFDRNRRHPILGIRRPHLGVDLAAPVGTPIQAAARGTVTERTRNGGYGRVVTLRHGQRRKTRYAHLSRYAKGLRVGDRVERGEVIGYVGRTGTTTGPHLHYEFIEQGRHRNPVTVDLPRQESIPERHAPEFERHVAPLLAALRGESSTELQLVQREE